MVATVAGNKINTGVPDIPSEIDIQIPKELPGRLTKIRELDIFKPDEFVFKSPQEFRQSSSGAVVVIPTYTGGREIVAIPNYNFGTKVDIAPAIYGAQWV